MSFVSVGMLTIITLIIALINETGRARENHPRHALRAYVFYITVDIATLVLFLAIAWQSVSLASSNIVLSLSILAALFIAFTVLALFLRRCVDQRLSRQEAKS